MKIVLAVLTLLSSFPAFAQAEIRLTKPVYKKCFFPGQDSSEIRGELLLTLSPEERQSAEAEVTLTIEGQDAKTLKLKTDAEKIPFSFESGKLQPGGKALLTVTLRADGKDLASVSQSVRRLVPPAGIKCTWIENGVLIRDGAPWYPRYIYAPGYRGGRAFDARYKADDLADTPFVRAGLEPERMIRGIEKAEARRDVRPCPEMFEKIRQAVEKKRNDPNLDFYYICDEPDYRTVSPVYLKYIYDFVSELDPYHPVITCTKDPGRYREAADILSTHPYIKPVETMGRRFLTRPISQVRKHLRRLTQFHRPDKVSGFTGQFFSYAFNNTMADYPTWEEVESMSWSAIANGSRFHWPYAYHDLGDRPHLYQGYRYINQSIKALEKLLLSNNKLPVKAEDPEDRIDAMLVEEEGVTLLIVVNLKNGPLKTVVSSDHLKKFSSLLEFRGTGSRTIEDGKIALSLKPYECVVLTSKKLDDGLETRDEVVRKISEAEKARTGRGNLLFDKGLSLEVKAHNFTRGTVDGTFVVRNKLFDGVLDVQAWASRPRKEPHWLELHFWKNPPKFRKLWIHGSSVDKAVVKLWRDGAWQEPEAKSVENAEYSSLREFPDEISGSKIRFEFPGNLPVELYEIELFE